jgi:hypothetical protein
MSIGSIDPASAILSASPQTTVGFAASGPANEPDRAAMAAPTPAARIDEELQPPRPPRFPWLSRLSEQLLQAANQHPAFTAAPVLGNHVDKEA